MFNKKKNKKVETTTQKTEIKQNSRFIIPAGEKDDKPGKIRYPCPKGCGATSGSSFYMSTIHAPSCRYNPKKK